MAYLDSQIRIPILIPFLRRQFRLESESKSPQYEKLFIVQGSRLVCNPNQNRYENPEFYVNKP